MTGSDRFAFGRNWRDFVEKVDEQRILGAEASLTELLEVDRLDGQRVLDVGCGSGLFSLAAHRLGAASVRSFDYDDDSVAATTELRRRFAADAADWTVEQGSILDPAYVSSLGTFDLVYSWGVLHHTGDLWKACELAATLVAPGGTLFIAIYNDQGRNSRMWTRIKQAYVSGGRARRAALVGGSGAVLYGRALVWDVLHLTNPLARYRTERARGMSRWNDLLDWVGGYPFEVAKPEQIHDFFRARGFRLDRMTTCAGGLGCNQFVLRSTAGR